MPFAFIAVGLLLVAAGVRDQSSNLLTLLKGDMTGDNNFAYWIISILIIGSLGYVGPLRPFSRACLVLVILVLFLKTGNPNGTGGGFFDEFSSAVKNITKG